MKLSNESWLQIGIAVATIIASSFVPEIRSFLENLFRNIPVLLIVIGIVAIFYLQTKKMVKKSQKLFEEKYEAKENNFAAMQVKWQSEYDEKLKKLITMIEQHSFIIDKMQKTESLHLSITKIAILPFIYEEYKEEVIKKMYYNNVQIPSLLEHGFEAGMTTEYQKFYHQKEMERYSS